MDSSAGRLTMKLRERPRHDYTEEISRFASHRKTPRKIPSHHSALSQRSSSSGGQRDDLLEIASQSSSSSLVPSDRATAGTSVDGDDNNTDNGDENSDDNSPFPDSPSKLSYVSLNKSRTAGAFSPAKSSSRLVDYADTPMASATNDQEGEATGTVRRPAASARRLPVRRVFGAAADSGTAADSAAGASTDAAAAEGAPVPRYVDARAHSPDTPTPGVIEKAPVVPQGLILFRAIMISGVTLFYRLTVFLMLAPSNDDKWTEPNEGMEEHRESEFGHYKKQYNAIQALVLSFVHLARVITYFPFTLREFLRPSIENMKPSKPHPVFVRSLINSAIYLVRRIVMLPLSSFAMARSQQQEGGGAEVDGAAEDVASSEDHPHHRHHHHPHHQDMGITFFSGLLLSTYYMVLRISHPTLPMLSAYAESMSALYMAGQMNVALIIAGIKLVLNLPVIRRPLDMMRRILPFRLIFATIVIFFIGRLTMPQYVPSARTLGRAVSGYADIRRFPTLEASFSHLVSPAPYDPEIYARLDALEQTTRNLASSVDGFKKSFEGGQRDVPADHAAGNSLLMDQLRTLEREFKEVRQSSEGQTSAYSSMKLLFDSQTTASDTRFRSLESKVSILDHLPVEIVNGRVVVSPELQQYLDERFSPKTLVKKVESLGAQGAGTVVSESAWSHLGESIESLQQSLASKDADRAALVDRLGVLENSVRQLTEEIHSKVESSKHAADMNSVERKTDEIKGEIEEVTKAVALLKSAVTAGTDRPPSPPSEPLGETREQFVRQVQELSSSIDNLRAQLTQEINSVRTGGGSGALLDWDQLRSEMNKIVKQSLDLFAADRIGKPDFALASTGAQIVLRLTSKSFVPPDYYFGSLLGAGLVEPPETVLDPNVNVGKCWAMAGDHGHVGVRLPLRVKPTHFTIDHVDASLALDRSSAPKLFSVWGLRDVESPETAVLLTRATFLLDQPSYQTFVVQAKADEAFNVFQLRVESNHGHPDYTCIYRFRIHGFPA